MNLSNININYPLICHRLLGVLLCILFIGLSAVDASAEGWTNLGNQQGVKVQRKQVKGSPLFAFRGEIEADIGLDVVLATFSDPKQRKYWVDRYESHKTIKKTETTEHYWIRFALPPLVSDRDYVLFSNAKVDEDHGVIEVTVQSKAHPDYPEECCVRAVVKQTYYRFTALSRSKTKLEVEVHTDPKGLLPNWLVNLIQKRWPSKTLNGLIKQARRANKRHPKVKALLEKRFPE